MASIEYLGRLSQQVTPSESIHLTEKIDTVTKLRAHLGDIHQTNALSDKSVRVAVNDVIVSDNYSLSNDDRIAFFPPVGGG